MTSIKDTTVSAENSMPAAPAMLRSVSTSASEPSFGKVAALVVCPIRYVWSHRKHNIKIHEIVDMFYRVVLYARNGLLFDSVVDCRIPGVLDFKVSDRTAPYLLERLSRRVVDFDFLIIAPCSELANRYVVLHDHERIFDCLRFELPPERRVV